MTLPAPDGPRVRPPLLLAALALALLAAGTSAREGPFRAEGGYPGTAVYGRDRAEMVLVPAGPFTMGSDSHDADEAPATVVDLPAFYIDRTEVTNARFALFLNSLRPSARRHVSRWQAQGPTTDVVLGPDDRYHAVPGTDHLPVRFVSWHGAMAYARWAGKELPTEAQWEKAARGTDGRPYPWGHRWSPLRASTYGVGDGVAMVAPVGAFPLGASPYGALDMAGNMWEWTRSLHKDYPYRDGDGRNDPAAPGPRVLRSSSYVYNSPQWTVRASNRYSDLPEYSDDDYGLRCVAPASEVFPERSP